MALVEVRVRLSGQETILRVPEGTPVGTLPKRLDRKWRDNVVVIVNGKVAKKDDLLDPMDRVVILPLLAGG